MKGLKKTEDKKFNTYYNRLVFDSKLDERLKNISTTDISNALENSPIIDSKNQFIGAIHNVTHRNGTLYYGDLVITDKNYSKKCSIERQDLTFDNNNQLSHIVSYLSDKHE